MARQGKATKDIMQYDHLNKKRKNNPPVGLVTPATDQDAGKKTYAYDPHLDPALQWAGKAEHTSFEVPIVSLHVHERIDPKTIIEAVRNRNVGAHSRAPLQLGLFEKVEENPPLREAIDFYKHDHNWSNRLIASDSLLVMNSLLEKEGMAGQVQMVYIDPPYGIRYGSNFQPFVNKRDVKDGKDEDLTQEPEMIRAFRDTWELGIHSYLTYLRDRLLLARELLHESGSCFVQISDENVHLVRNLMDEVFGAENFIALIMFAKSGGTTSELLSSPNDYLVWYARERKKIKYRQLFKEKTTGTDGQSAYSRVELPNGQRRAMTKEEKADPSKLTPGSHIYRLDNLTSQGFRQYTTVPFGFEGKTYHPGNERNWKTTIDGLRRLVSERRLEATTGLYYVRYLDDFPVFPTSNNWEDTGIAGFASDKKYVVETNEKVIARCPLMTTDPGDLVLDPTCGSGTTAYVAEQWSRRWVTCDSSRVAITLAKQRLMTALFDYYELARPKEGVSSGFVYKTVSHVTLKSIANNEPPAQETLYDQPKVDNSKARVTGPFTVEAVPAPMVRPIADVGATGRSSLPGDQSLVRSGETLRQAEWRDELLKTGVRGKNGQMILFSRVEPLSGARWLHADAETVPNNRGADSVHEGGIAYASPQRVVISFSPEHAPLEKRQVEMAWEEARTLNPKPAIILFAAFQFDPEAAKDIDELTQDKTGMTFLKVQMNTDLLTADLKKKRASNQSFWLIGQPDVELRPAKKSAMYEVEVHGFDYYNTKTGAIESGDTGKIALWMLDTDYDGRSLYPRQVFFPMADENDGWARLAKNLKAEIDLDRVEAYRGTVPLPFEPGKHQRVAVKIVDDRGIESLKIVEVKP